MRGGRVPPRQQYQQRALPKQLQQQHQQRRAAASRPQPVQKQPHQQPQYRPQVRRQPPPQGYTVQNTGGGAKKNYVGQLEGALQSIRYEREREYRGRNAAQERLRAELEKFQALKTEVEEQKTKNQKVSKEDAAVQKEIGDTEFSNKELAMKVRNPGNVLLSLLLLPRLLLLSHIL